MSVIPGWFGYKCKLDNQVATAMQVQGVENAFNKLFQLHKFNQVLEIGTASGGTTLIVRDAMNEHGMRDSIIRTYDTNTSDKNLQSYISKGEKIEFLNDNLFDSSGTKIKSDSAEPKNFIQRPGKTLVLCDGGGKRFELPSISPFLKSGDIIMAHDYAKDSEYFRANIENKIWNWHEISDAHISHSMQKYNLFKIMEQDFDSVVWVCLQKK